MHEQQKALVQAEPEPVIEAPIAVTPEKETSCVEATEHAAEEVAEARPKTKFQRIDDLDCRCLQQKKCQVQEAESKEAKVAALFPDLILPQSMVETIGTAAPETLSNVVAMAEARFLPQDFFS